jgi:hypothetical protein
LDFEPVGESIILILIIVFIVFPILYSWLYLYCEVLRNVSERTRRTSHASVTPMSDVEMGYVSTAATGDAPTAAGANTIIVASVAGGDNKSSLI